jgi:membrane-bound lytic murein transglycosylase A
MKKQNSILPLVYQGKLGAVVFVATFLVACSTPPLLVPEPTLPSATLPVKPVEPVIAPVSTAPAQVLVTPVVPSQTTIVKYAEIYKPAKYADLPGWSSDDLRQLWPAYLASCSALRFRLEWRDVCNSSKTIDGNDNAAIRSYFEKSFTPHQVVNADGSNDGMVTGYYEPLLKGSRSKGGIFQTPLYSTPSDMLTVDLGSVYPELKNMRLRGRLVGNKVLPYPSRAEIVPSLKGKELVWVDDAVDAFFLQIQGSGRVELNETGETIRMAYADQNGHPYKSIGRYLVGIGELTLDQASAQGIKEWIAKNPNRQEELLNVNPSMVFFKEEKLTDPSIGPKGAQGVPLTPERSIAIDPTQLPLGAPIYLSTTRPNSKQNLQRLMMAQDTGGAIRGAVRADFFWGFGREPGELAGRMKQRGNMWLLLPKVAN